MRAAAVSAPGKAILMGEHAAIHGRPALVAALSLRTTATVASAEAGRVRLELPAVGFAGAMPWDEVDHLTLAAREAWVRASRGAAGPVQPSKGPERLAVLALGEAAAAAGASRPGIALRVVSEVPPGSGFGSSAALAVAVTAAYFRFLGAAPDPEKIGAAALEVERRQHGTPSGIDTAAALSGGVLWAYRAAGSALATEPVRAVSPALAKIRAFHSGPASESTGAVVAAVRGRLAADPRATEAHLDAIGTAAARLRTALEARIEDAAGVLDAIRRGERALEGLGVVPETVRRAVRAIEDAGGAAKISGAGALRGDGAGLVLVYHPDPAWWDGFAAPAPWRPIAAAFGAPGARMESVA